ALGVFSFNGNKIITTSGGGMLVGRDGELIEHARHLAAQARDPAPHYEHSAIGHNYRLSNLLAAVGRGQLFALDDKVRARGRVNLRYRENLSDLPGLAFMPCAGYGRPNCWLTCLTLVPERFGATRDDVLVALAAVDIEARPVWKPMHLQPVFADVPCVGGGVAADLFDRGLCLPSGSALTEAEQDEIIDRIRRCARG
ncbi:MAG: pyridoxal phosphate-dependent aminotransferase, partial [Nitriliruptorales bacterium]|nr:pyridoxal phosphate-dependent aminotransferase [Nitriliruptorales bacterium]